MDERRAIARLKRGDIGGLETLVRVHQGRAVGAAYLIVRDWPLAEGLVQSAFIRVYERIDQFDDTRPFVPWFLRIVTNDATKTSTRMRRHLPLDSPHGAHEDDTDSLLDYLADGAPGPVELLEQAESRAAVWAAMERLSPSQREAVVLRYYLELTETQVADRLGVAPGTAKWHLHHARKRLAGLLGGRKPDRNELAASADNPDAVPPAEERRSLMSRHTPRTPLGRYLAEQVAHARPHRVDLWPAIAAEIDARHRQATAPRRRWLREGLQLAGAIALVVLLGLVLARLFAPSEEQQGTPGTPTVEANPSPTPLVYVDEDFEVVAASDWFESASLAEGISATAANGAYQLTVEGNLWVVAPPSPIRMERGRIQVTVTLDGWGIAGVAGRVSRTDVSGVGKSLDYFACGITTWGEARCAVYVADQPRELFRTSMDVIDPGGANVLTLTIIDETLEFRVNGQVIGTAPAAAPARGFWGIFAQNGERAVPLEGESAALTVPFADLPNGEGPLTASFDDLQIVQLRRSR